MNKYREIYESIESILDEEEVEIEEEEGEESLSPQELLKDIVGCLSHCTEQLAANEMDDVGSFVEKLKKVRDILSEGEYDVSHEDEEMVEEDSPFPEIKGDEYGTQGMGPSIDSSGKQHYENPQGQSFAARKGFVGM